MHQIRFKKQAEGMWRRDDGETKTLVTDSEMHNEIQDLYNDGWRIETHGISFLRAVTMTRYRKFPP